ncbi:MAG: hypothetical protein K6B14_09965, partial [Lachnospiraceae bacterium]|nr:hypothetical protein [Lachnospiraceae bacterium]
MVEEKKTINRVLALLMVFVVVVSAIGFAPMRGEAAPAPTPVTVNSVTYNNTGSNPTITVDFTDVDDRNNADILLAQPNGPGNGIGDIEFNGETCGFYSFNTIDMATATSLGGHRYTASLPTYLGDDGTKPGVGLTVYVGILVSNTNDEDNTTAIDLVSLVVPAEGQSITVTGGGTPQQQCDHVNTTRTRHSTSSNTQHEVRCGTCGAVVETENHVWNQDAYQENGNSHSRVCTLCGYNDTHTIDSDGYWLTVGTQQTCRGPGCRTCRQPVSVSRVSDLSQICHQIRLEANPSKTTHKAWCGRCGYEFGQNAPCFDTVDWYHLAPDNIDEDVIDWVELHYLHENGNGTATITCACGNTKTVNMKGKVTDRGNANKNLDPGFGIIPNFNNNQVNVKTEPLISDEDFSKLLNSINADNNVKQELEAKMAQQGIDNIETATVTAEVGSVNIDLSEPFATTGTGDNTVSTATLDVSMGFRLKFTSGNKEINIDQDFNMLVEKPTLIRVPVPDNFGDNNDPVKVEHTHQGKEYVYYGKVLQITNDPVIGTC